MEVMMLSATVVEQLLDADLLLEALAEGFRALSRGDVVAPARNEIQVPNAGSVLLMPAWQPSANITVKLVSIFHGNEQVNLPSHQALICLFDAATGTPVAVMDGGALTAIRTAAAAALSTRLLARPQAEILTIVGAGVQGAAHLRLVSRVHDFREIRIVSRTLAHAQTLAGQHPHAHAWSSLEEATRGADVICLCTSSSQPLIQWNWLSGGAHVTSVGYMPPGGELDHAIAEQGHLFVETRQAFAPPPAGSSELTGLDPDAASELGEVLLGTRPGRLSEHEVTVYKSMGHAMEDLVSANLVYQRARQAKIEQIVTL